MNIRILGDIVEVDYEPVFKFICPEQDIPRYKEILDPEELALSKEYERGVSHGYDDGHADGVEFGQEEIILENTKALDKLLKDGLISRNQHSTIKSVLKL